MEATAGSRANPKLEGHGLALTDERVLSSGTGPKFAGALIRPLHHLLFGSGRHHFWSAGSGGPRSCWPSPRTACGGWRTRTGPAVPRARALAEAEAVMADHPIGQAMAAQAPASVPAPASDLALLWGRRAERLIVARPATTVCCTQPGVGGAGPRWVRRPPLRPARRGSGRRAGSDGRGRERLRRVGPEAAFFGPPTPTSGGTATATTSCSTRRAGHRPRST